ncbi:hypothetical protein LZ31DRAFT_46826 [Colletotrichum somersetense]|nr:hypothetical protein LZ31DRAFT_46826 [Colletotrichum somersetense]
MMSVVFLFSPSPSLPLSAFFSTTTRDFCAVEKQTQGIGTMLADFGGWKAPQDRGGEGGVVCMTDSFTNKHLAHHVHFVSHCATSSDKTSAAATRKSDKRPQARGGRERGRDILRGINRIAKTGSYVNSFRAARCPISPTRG